MGEFSQGEIGLAPLSPASLPESHVAANRVQGIHNGPHLHKSGHQCQSRFTEQFPSTLNSNIYAYALKSQTAESIHTVISLVQALS